MPGNHNSLSVNKESTQADFLVLLESLINQVCNNLLQVRQADKLLKKLVDKRRLVKLIKYNLGNMLLPVIARTCVYEMHAARQNNFLKGDTAEQRFKFFVDKLSETETSSALFEKYPILKNLCEIICHHFTKSQTELLLRLAADYSELESIFFHHEAGYRLKDIIASGDAHKNGRQVTILLFYKGKQEVKLVYKPRSLAIDSAFQKLIYWFNDLCKDINLFFPLLLIKKDYGWCQFISHAECKTDNEIKRFYQRMGALLCISHLLGATDIHAENIIAHASHPVFIDVECLLKPVFQTEYKSDAPLPLHLLTETYLLPHKFMVRDDYNGIDLSGIAAAGEEEAPYLVMKWHKVGTDEMCIVREKTYMPTFSNLPLLKNKVVDPLLYEQDIRTGFVKFYQLVLQYKAELLSESSPFNYFASAQVRVIMRATSTYKKLLSESYHPLLLYNVEEQAKHFLWLQEHISRSPLLHHAILASELSDLATNNIPYFSCEANGYQLYNSEGERIKIPVAYSPLERVKKLLSTYWGEQDMQLQLALFENSFLASRMDKKKDISFACKKKINHKNELPIHALEIAQHFLKKLLDYKIAEPGKICWPCVKPVGVDAFAASITDSSLYDGVAGIGLTFAYAAYIFNNTVYQQTAQASLDALHYLLLEKQQKAVKNIGAFTGLGGLLYVYGQYNYLFPTEYIQDDISLLLEWAPNFIKADQSFDVIAGCAGFIAILLAIKNYVKPTQFSALLKQATLHLCKAYKELSTNNEKCLPGFAHGLTGVIWAVTKANQILQDKAISNWIQKALCYERSQFNIIKNDWPGPVSLADSGQSVSLSWCRGLSGLALSRLSIYNNLSDDIISNEINWAVEKTIRQSESPALLCHGALSCLELLYKAAQHQLVTQDICNQQVKRIMNDMRNRDFYFDIPGEMSRPGLMTGYAGLIYQLLRMSYPEKVPCILLLEGGFSSQASGLLLK